MSDKPKSLRDKLKSRGPRVVAAISVAATVVGLLAGIKTLVDGNDNVSDRPTVTAPPPPPPRPKPTGQIVSPDSGDAVKRDIVARGTLAHIPEDQHVWAVVRDGNLLYPQDSEVTPPDGEWRLGFRQGGRTRVVSLELYRMGDKGHRLITDRFNNKDFSGISLIPGAKRLDAVENLRIRD